PRLHAARCGRSSASSLLSLPHSTAPHLSSLPLHDALPLSRPVRRRGPARGGRAARLVGRVVGPPAPGRGVDGRVLRVRPRLRLQDRKSTRLNSSHVKISYAVFCLKKKKQERRTRAPGSHAS